MSVNLAKIPEGWEPPNQIGTVHQWFLDSVNVRTPTKPSMRIDRVANLGNIEINIKMGTAWAIPIKPLDHILFRGWIKTSAGSAIEAADIYSGGRIGIDLYARCALHGNIVGAIGYSVPHDGAEHIAQMVRFGTSVWTFREWDIFVSDDDITTGVDTERGVHTIPAAKISYMIPWCQLCVKDGTPETTKTWIADTELYINAVPMGSLAISAKLDGVEIVGQYQVTGGGV